MYTKLFTIPNFFSIFLEKMGKIYLITELNSQTPRYKLGKTKRKVSQRLKEHQTGASNELIIVAEYESEYYHKIEFFLKNTYKLYATDGGTEWFELPDDVMNNFLSECKKAEQKFSFLKNYGNPFI